MSGGVWLKCDHCNKGLGAAVTQEMQLAVRFKPALFPVRVAPLHDKEHRQRCRSCGWVNIFVPVTVAVVVPARESLLTPPWRRVTVKS